MIFFLLTLVGFALRLGSLGAQGTLWFDEAFSVHFASMPIRDLFHFLLRDVHPTLYYLLLHFWMAAFGSGDVAARMLSVVLGALAVPAVGALAWEAFGKRAGYVAAALTAVSPPLLFQSAEARMYPLLVVLSALAAREWLRLLKEGEAKRGLWRWALLSAAMLFTHFTAVTPFAVMALSGAYARRKDRRSLIRFLAVAAASAVPFAIWFFSAAFGRMGSVGREWQLNFGNESRVPLSYHFVGFFADGTMPWQSAFLFAILIVLILVAVLSWRREPGALAWRVEPVRDARIWTLFALTVLPFLAFVAVTTAVTKYFVIAFPAAAALAAGGFSRLVDGIAGVPARNKAVAVCALLYLATIGGSVASLMTGRRIEYDAVAKFISDEGGPGDIVYASWFPSLLPLERYYKGDLPLFAIDPYEGQMTFDDQLILHTGQAMTKDDLDAAEKKLMERARSARRVFLVTGATGLAATPVEFWFSERGWVLEKKFVRSDFTPIVYVLRNPAL